MSHLFCMLVGVSPNMTRSNFVRATSRWANQNATVSPDVTLVFDKKTTQLHDSSYQRRTFNSTHSALEPALQGLLDSCKPMQ